jgi:hypothetical protein
MTLSDQKNRLALYRQGSRDGASRIERVAELASFLGRVRRVGGRKIMGR